MPSLRAPCPKGHPCHHLSTRCPPILCGRCGEIENRITRYSCSAAVETKTELKCPSLVVFLKYQRRNDKGWGIRDEEITKKEASTGSARFENSKPRRVHEKVPLPEPRSCHRLHRLLPPPAWSPLVQAARMLAHDKRSRPDCKLD